MMRGIRRFSVRCWWILAWAAAAAGCAAGTGGRDPGGSAPVPVSALVAAGAEPGAWARAAQGRCGALPFGARMACYDEVLLALLDAAGVGAAMETLERIGVLDTETLHHGHVLAHHIGIAAYRGADRVGEVFGQCRPSFQSGCHHGVIQAYFADVQVGAGARLDAERLNRLCQPYRGAKGDQWLLFQCLHGMGHGLVALHDNHLPRALAGCDLLEEPWEREGCYGGAFMENIVGATMPHHAPRAESPAHGGHGGHDADGHTHHGHHPDQPADHAGEPPHHAHAGAAPFPRLDRADPHYPCSVLEERYQYGCYSMQTSAVLFWSEGDIAPAIRLCEEAPEWVRRICYVSLGRDINAWSHQDHALAAERCLRVPADFQPNCLIGVAKNLIDITADPDDGVAFCRGLAPGWNRERCFQAVGEQVAVLEASAERRAEFCGRFDGEDARGCRFGAAVADPGAAAAREGS
jgi:hypothetical protein